MAVPIPHAEYNAETAERGLDPYSAGLNRSGKTARKARWSRHVATHGSTRPPYKRCRSPCLAVNQPASQRGKDNARCHTVYSTEDAWALRRDILSSCYNTPDGHPRHSRNFR
jgi:hypothetical protein